MTLLEQPEFKGRPRPLESTAIFQKAAAVAIVNPTNEVLLMQRVDYGDWVYPGGMVEPGESPDSATRRETLEESGISLEPGVNQLFPLANYITAPDSFNAQYDLLVYVTKLQSMPEPRIASPQEMIGFDWFEPSTALRMAQSGQLRILPSGIFAIRRLKEYLSNEKIRQYGEVLMGGTFDRLHKGHKSLLAKAFTVGDYVYIGLTTDGYVARSQKQLKEKVLPFEQRLYELRQYLFEQGVLNRAIILPLEDTAGPKALDPKLEAIVVSEETKGGGEYVNIFRAKNNVPPMDTVVVPLITDLTGEVISSTRIRRQE